MSELYVDPPAVEAMIAALGTSRTALEAVPTKSFIAQIEEALPGSGLGHAYMQAGWRANAGVRGVGGQLQEIADKAKADIAAFQAGDSQNALGITGAGDQPR
ncbi:hypothetical protein [Nocardia cyriacigeorgica]|uniref:ESX-1 secretion-associated protein n=1 Tax=Nocardia cyriacigeorgica TaxID=135487 RepID=A0A5R8NRP6_9NOCA|nr:hypothetical protein [Nocardia cyriacigeorgica]TLF78359.1 hypothetical protein FEK34_10900 [Nocardia cyriacigeorgica]